MTNSKFIKCVSANVAKTMDLTKDAPEEFNTLKELAEGKENKLSLSNYQGIYNSTLETDKYYVFQGNNSVHVNLPNMYGVNSVENIIVYLELGSSTPQVTFNAGGATVKYQSDYELEAGATYELNFLWNGVCWVVTYVKFD